MRWFKTVLVTLALLATFPVLAQPADPGDAAVMAAAAVPAVSATPTVAPDAAIASAPAQPATVALPKPINPDDTGVVGFLKLIVDAARGGNWKLAVVLGLVFLVWLTRKYGGMIPGPVGAALKSDAGGVITAFIWSFVGTLGAAMSLGLGVDLPLVGSALLLAFAAMGGWVAIKKMLPASWREKLPWLFGDSKLADLQPPTP